MKTHLLVTSTVLSAFLSLSALAQTSPQTPRIDQRQINQEQRIQQGIRSGQLSPEETHKLDRGQERLNRIEDKAKADGVVTEAERRRLETVQDHQSGNIRRARHDNQLTIDQRQDKQEQRIKSGIGSGELTSQEVHRLDKGQARVNRIENRVREDGVVSRAERRRLQVAQDRQSGRIYRAKHNKRQNAVISK